MRVKLNGIELLVVLSILGIIAGIFSRVGDFELRS